LEADRLEALGLLVEAYESGFDETRNVECAAQRLAQQGGIE
jgi:hypothetical protein